MVEIKKVEVREAMLQEQLLSKEEINGINYWEASVYRAVLNADDILKTFLKEDGAS